MFAPFGNSSQAVVHWQPEPTTRGTSTILTTCIITITLCVWTAIHMNIPAADERQGKIPVWRKIGWLIVALIAPEFVVYTAWYQRRVASEMLRGLQNIFGQEPPPSRFARMRRKIFNKPAGDSRDLQKHEEARDRYSVTTMSREKREFQRISSQQALQNKSVTSPWLSDQSLALHFS